MTDDWDAVFFDIGGVIVSLPAIRQGYADYLREFATERNLDPEWTLDTWRSALGEYFAGAEGTEYRPAREGYARAFDALVDGDLAEAEWRPGFERATGAALEPEPGAVETVRTLAETDLYLGVISDIDTLEAHRMFEQFGIDGAFDGVTTSEDVGRKKPDSAMFADALAATDVRPDRSLMVGDRYEHDMQGGKRAGLRTVAYGGTAAETVAGAEREEYRVLGDDAVDYVVSDLREILDIVGARE